MRKILLLFILFITFISNSFAHSGRTDSNGGHYDRSTGEYHYHKNGYVEENNVEDNTSGTLRVKDTDVNYLQKEIDNKQNKIDSLQEQVYSKQNTISRLNNMIVDKNEEIKNLKDMQVYMWISFILIFLLGIYISYKRGLNEKDN